MIYKVRLNTSSLPRISTRILDTPKPFLIETKPLIDSDIYWQQILNLINSFYEKKNYFILL